MTKYEDLPYCPLKDGRVSFEDCILCKEKSLGCDAFHLYINGQITNEQMFIEAKQQISLLLSHKTFVCLIFDDFDSSFIGFAKARGYDYIIAKAMNGEKERAAIDFLLKQKEKGIIIFGDRYDLKKMQNVINQEAKELSKEYYIANNLQVRFFEDKKAEKIL